MPDLRPFGPSAFGAEIHGGEEAGDLLVRIEVHPLQPRYVRGHRHAAGEVMAPDTSTAAAAVAVRPGGGGAA